MEFLALVAPERRRYRPTRRQAGWLSSNYSFKRTRGKARAPLTSSVSHEGGVMKRFRLLVVAAVALVFATGIARADCEDGHWVQSVSSDGAIVILEDGSVWEIDPADRVDTALWLPITNIVACDDKLIDTDDNEIAEATRIK